MWNNKISFWLYGMVWLCQDMIGINHVEINCISVNSKTNRKLRYFHQPYLESDASFETNNKLPERLKEDFTQGTGVKKKYEDFIDDTDYNSLDISPNKTSGIVSPYLISIGLNPFGSSFPWNGQEIFPTDFLQNENISSQSYKVSDKNVNNKVEIREKRGVAHLYNMIECATGCNPLSYKGYGCYCGFLGSGNSADPIDSCCKRHDSCYSNVNCPVFSVYVTPYLWRCWNGYPQCALDHVGYGGHNSCAAQLCQCDKQLAMCLANWPCPHRRALCRSSPFRLFQNLLLF